jgi:hypothetical protein
MALRVLRFALGENDEALFPELFTFVELDSSNPYSVEIGNKTWGLLYAYTRNANFEELEEQRRFFAWEWEKLPQNVISVEEWTQAVAKGGTKGFKYEFDETAKERLKSAESLFDLFATLWANGLESMAQDIERERGKDQWEDFSKIKIEKVKRDTEEEKDNHQREGFSKIKIEKVERDGDKPERFD